MSRHRQPSHRHDRRRSPGARRAQPVSRPGRRRSARPRTTRIAFAVTAFAVTLVAVLAGVGVIPVQSRPPASAQERAAAGAAGVVDHGPGRHTQRPSSARTVSRDAKTLPDASGTGRRIVFDIGRQRVWLVDASGKVARTYLVSGSLTDNLVPGTYSVFSKSRWAVGIDDSGTMQYFVRFAHGVNAAIGFHSIPTKGGHPLQTVAQLGTPRSHGCIRQKLADAIELWDFAPVGTKVVVTS